MGCPNRISGRLREWQAEWSGRHELAERQVAAARSSALAVAALEDHSRAYRQNLNSHPDGGMVVSILKLLDHLSVHTGLAPEAADVDDIFDVIPAVRIAARAALERAEEAAGAHATLGELWLVTGDQTSPQDRDRALNHYAAARASAPDREALVERLHLFAALGFRPGLVSQAMHVLEQ